MRRLFHAAALISVGAAIGLGVVVVNAGASPSPLTNTNLNATGTAIGQPLPIRVAGTGFSPGSLVFVEQCDGVDPTSTGWSPTTNCDLGTSPSPAIADATGKVVFDANDPNHAFTPFKGVSPQGLFNCLSANEASLAPSNGLPDFRNCQVRVSSNNVAITADRQFFDLTLPDAPWEALAHNAGSCAGQQMLGTWKPNESNVAAPEALSTGLLKNLSTKLPIAGTCNFGGVATTLTPHSFSFKVAGSTKCTATAADAPTVGKLSVTMNETDPVTTKPYVLQAYVRRTPAVDPNAPDIALYQGTITNGEEAGMTIVGTLYEDPVVKAPKGVVTTTGYVDSHTDLTHCQAGSATISTVQIGSGTSMFGGNASGLHFGY